MPTITNNTGLNLIFTPDVGGVVPIGNGQSAEIEEDGALTVDPGLGGGSGEEHRP